MHLVKSLFVILSALLPIVSADTCGAMKDSYASNTCCGRDVALKSAFGTAMPMTVFKPYPVGSYGLAEKGERYNTLFAGLVVGVEVANCPGLNDILSMLIGLVDVPSHPPSIRTFLGAPTQTVLSYIVELFVAETRLGYSYFTPELTEPPGNSSKPDAVTSSDMLAFDTKAMVALNAITIDAWASAPTAPHSVKDWMQFFIGVHCGNVVRMSGLVAPPTMLSLNGFTCLSVGTAPWFGAMFQYYMSAGGEGGGLSAGGDLLGEIRAAMDVANANTATL